ncbi:carboxypeptidase regulatory-like domain-containing protein [bacterium]|nr:carboxypeptidase regulatory-like domain-containing protein [bacterium]
MTPTVSSVTSNFNGTAIPAGDYLWFNSVAKVTGVTQPTTVHVTQATITFNAGTTAYTVAVPDSAVTLDPAQPAGTATAAYGAAGWEVSTRAPYSGNAFLAGAPWAVPAAIAGGSVKSITWAADFTADQPGLQIKWQWSAAVYTQFSTDPATLAVKPSDTATAQFPNSDHAGTPEAFKTFVTGGARGGGGSNFTGSYSSTKLVIPEVTTAPALLATLSGLVTDQNGAPQAGVHILLTGTTATGATVTRDTYTDEFGAYWFTDLPAGSYTVSEVPPPAPEGFEYLFSVATPGFVDGVEDGTADGQTVIGGIALAGGDDGEQYNFVNYYGPLG